MADRDWLDLKHPVYVEWVQRWRTNEARMRGGDAVAHELKRFDWELPDGRLPDYLGTQFQTSQTGKDAIPTGSFNPDKLSHLQRRQAEATYPNFPDQFAKGLVGLLTRKQPTPSAGLDFGRLGEVRRDRKGAQPTAAELIYYNADGVGNDGSQWDNFWAGAMQRAMGTGIRWVYVETPATAAATFADILAGKRPYLVELSPVSVPFWLFDHGQLQCLIARIRRPRLVTDGEGGIQIDNHPSYLLMTRKGFNSFGTEYESGGWWIFNSDKTPTAEKGSWATTKGDIPVAPLFYERDPGSEEQPAIARPAVTELGNLAISYMNLSSAADFDAWDAASSLQFLIGVDADGFNLAMSKITDGSRYVPLKGIANSGKNPEIKDGSMGSVTADVFDRRLRAKLEEAAKMAVTEVSGAPSSTGVSKQAGFIEGKSSRLALMASEMEACQNTILRFLELRFGVGAGIGEPTASVRWSRQYDIQNVEQEVQAMFAAERISGLRSPTAEVAAMMKLLEEKGLLVDDETRTKVEAELMKHAEAIVDMMRSGKLDAFTGKTSETTAASGNVAANLRTGSEA